MDSLPPLYDVVDPDALDSLFEDAAGPMNRAVSFDYCGFQVTVLDDGTVTVASLD